MAVRGEGGLFLSLELAYVEMFSDDIYISLLFSYLPHARSRTVT